MRGFQAVPVLLVKEGVGLKSGVRHRTYIYIYMFTRNIKLTMFCQISHGAQTTLRQPNDIDPHIRRGKFPQHLLKDISNVILPCLVTGDFIPERHPHRRLHGAASRKCMPHWQRHSLLFGAVPYQLPWICQNKPSSCREARAVILVWVIICVSNVSVDCLAPRVPRADVIA